MGATFCGYPMPGQGFSAGRRSKGLTSIGVIIDDCVLLEKVVRWHFDRMRAPVPGFGVIYGTHTRKQLVQCFPPSARKRRLDCLNDVPFRLLAWSIQVLLEVRKSPAGQFKFLSLGCMYVCMYVRMYVCRYVRVYA